MFCAIYNLETKEAEFIEQWDETHTEGIMEGWEGTIEQFFEFRCSCLEVDCQQRGYGKWKLYKSADIPFSWDVVMPKKSTKKT